MYFFIGSEFSDRGPQKSSSQKHTAISESGESLTTINSPPTRVSPFRIPRTQSAFHRHARRTAFPRDIGVISDYGFRRAIRYEEMFLGHYSVAFAARTERDKIPLWVLFVAVQLLDLLWAPFVFLGHEKVRIVLGITATRPLDLYYMPYTHSLIGALVWSALAAFVYKLVRGAKASSRAALIVALAVFSHWILDLIVHRPDLPIYDDTLKVGFGLLDYKGVEFAMEIALLVIGIALYLKFRCRADPGSDPDHVWGSAAFVQSYRRNHHALCRDCLCVGETKANPLLIGKMESGLNSESFREQGIFKAW